MLRRSLSFCLVACCIHVGANAEEISFNRDIRSILSNKCFSCHGPDANHRESDLRLDVADEAYEYGAVEPGSLEDSLLWERINSDDPDLVMPPPETAKPMEAEEVELLRRWIESGGQYEGHWAFAPPKLSEMPEAVASAGKHPIDAFLLATMQSAGLQPSPRAQKEILLRRVTFDLTGLPPTLAEIDAFLADIDPGAYERVVDRLLQSPNFGERMALEWMDAARYGDTSVFHADGPRDMWAWRDWVIEAFNSNLPYSEFVRLQIAGDLIPESTWEDKLATGFLRNNASTDEGGLIPEEYRVEYAVDRVKTTSMVFLGLSMECAQCHDHKYDPISQEEYYQFFAYFNQSADPGSQTRNGNQTPTVEIPDLTKTKALASVRSQVQDAEAALKQLREAHQASFAEWLEKRVGELPDEPDLVRELSPVAYLSFEGEEGDPLVDEVSQTELIRKGKPKKVAGKVASAIQTTSSDHLEAAKIGDFEREQAFSYGCWINAKSISGAPIARMDDGNGHRGYDLYLSNGMLAAHFIHHWPENALKVKAKADLKPNQWHHVFVTYDGAGKPDGVRLYVDGKPLKDIQVEQASLTEESIRTERPFTIGRRYSGSRFNGAVDEVLVFDRVLSDAEVAGLGSANSLSALLARAASEAGLSESEREQLVELFLLKEVPEFEQTTEALAALRKREEKLAQPKSTAMVMQDLPEMRQTYVLKRGQYDLPDKERPVEPGTPSFLPGVDGQPRNRLGLANWLVDPMNPLTARVTVNRYWRVFFGQGIVRSLEEFGSQGEWPSHPELLDWLAVDFQQNGWDTKRLVKMLVMTEAYQQSSRSTEKQLALDPENRLLSRGPRFRLQGEFIRDNALSVSGLLVPKIGGPGVKPYQPPGLWNEVSLTKNVRFKQDHGEALYRRSMYIYWKRSAPHPAMTIFDAPTREKCTVSRSATNTPLQALVLMNDPQFLEASRFLAERTLAEGGDSDTERLSFAYRTVTGRKPTQQVLSVLVTGLERERKRLADDEAAAKDLLSIGESPRDDSIQLGEHAAWTVISSLLLNLDATVTRG